MPESTNQKNGFILYFSSRAIVEKMSDEDAGVLFKLLFRYTETGQINENLPHDVDLVFAAIKDYLDKDKKKWEDARQQRIEAGRAGGIAKAQNQGTSKSKRNVAKASGASERQQTLAKKFDFPAEEILDLWNSICTALPPIRRVIGNREKSLRARWNEHSDIDWWKEFFNQIAASDFLNGKTTNWKANFDWCIKPANMDKILEGNYANKEAKKDYGSDFTDEDDGEDMSKWYELPEW